MTAPCVWPGASRGAVSSATRERVWVCRPGRSAAMTVGGATPRRRPGPLLRRRQRRRRVGDAVSGNFRGQPPVRLEASGVGSADAALPPPAGSNDVASCPLPPDTAAGSRPCPSFRGRSRGSAARFLLVRSNYVPRCVACPLLACLPSAFVGMPRNLILTSFWRKPVRFAAPSYLPASWCVREVTSDSDLSAGPLAPPSRGFTAWSPHERAVGVPRVGPGQRG